MHRRAVRAAAAAARLSHGITAVAGAACSRINADHDLTNRSLLRCPGGLRCRPASAAAAASRGGQ